MKFLKYKKRVAIILSVVVAIITFLGLYGPYTLDVTNISWIFYEFDGTDIIQHQAGWEQYRTSDWSFPLGYASNLSYGDGTYITYTDSIPYFAILFKLLRDILPETFQFFGWFTLLCFILQGMAACLLISRKSRNYIVILVGELFFLTSPILIERVFKHTALGAQWFILFSLYYYLEYRDSSRKSLPWTMVFLSVLTIGIHPYFIPMVMMFVLLIMLEAFGKKEKWYKIASFGGLSVGLTLLCGYLIGAVGTGIKATRVGYGTFSYNLNSLFNPRSYGYEWSKVLPIRNWTLNNYEGFNYIGLGMLIMLVYCIIQLLTHLIFVRGYWKKVGLALRHNWLLLLGLAFLAAFAITNIITFDDKILCEIELNPWLQDKCNIFRASGRMFFPVYYAIMIGAMYYVIDTAKSWVVSIVFILLVYVQIWDMSDVLNTKHEMLQNNYACHTLLEDENLNAIPDKDVLVLIGTEDFNLQRRLAIWAGERNIGVAYSVANTGIYAKSVEFKQQLELEMATGQIRDNVIYVTQDEDVMGAWRIALQGQEYKEYCRGYYYFVYTE